MPDYIQRIDDTNDVRQTMMTTCQSVHGKRLHARLAAAAREREGGESGHGHEAVREAGSCDLQVADGPLAAELLFHSMKQFAQSP